MTGERPGVMVSSTFYDLRELRQQLATFIDEELGYRAFLSEAPTFPIDADADAIENCRRRVEQNADVLVLIIGNRYGSVTTDSTKSITNLEYLAARAKQIPVYAYVEKRTLALFEAWRASPGPAREALGATVDDARLFSFIETVRNGDAVWMVEFDRAAEIIEALRSQFAYLMKRGLDIQRAVRRNSDYDLLRTLSGNAFRLAVEKPAAWEYRLFAQVLDDEIEAASVARREYDLRLVYGAPELLELLEVVDWATRQNKELERLVVASKSLVDVTLQDAFGPPGKPGDVGELVFVARQLGRIYRDAIAWGQSVRRVHATRDDVAAVLDAMAPLSSGLVTSLAALGKTLREGVERALEKAASRNPSDPPPSVEITFTLDLPGHEAVIDAMRRLGS